MHIPDNYLSPETCAVMTAAMVPVWAHAIKKVKTEVPREKMPMLGVGAAFSFTGMMFNIPLPGGTTGHAVGGTLLSVMLGPEAACLCVTIALLIQALLFGDGGILAFGANCFNMAFVLPFTGYGAYRLAGWLIRRMTGRGGDRQEPSVELQNQQPCANGPDLIAAAFGSYVGMNMAALCAAIEFGIQPLLFQDASGQALYCPYGLSISLPAMMIGHLTLFGAAEVIFTVALLAFLRKVNRTSSNSDVTSGTGKPIPAAGKAVYLLLAALICAVPLGLLATGTAWGEWDATEIGITEQFTFGSLLPDYSCKGLPDFAGYILSAVIGVSLLVIFFRLVSTFMKKKTNYDA